MASAIAVVFVGDDAVDEHHSLVEGETLVWV